MTKKPLTTRQLDLIDRLTHANSTVADLEGLQHILMNTTAQKGQIQVLSVASLSVPSDYHDWVVDVYLPERDIPYEEAGKFVLFLYAGKVFLIMRATDYEIKSSTADMVGEDILQIVFNDTLATMFVPDGFEKYITDEIGFFMMQAYLFHKGISVVLGRDPDLNFGKDVPITITKL